MLGSAISDREDLRMEVMASLRKLVNQSRDNSEYTGPGVGERVQQ